MDEFCLKEGKRCIMWDDEGSGFFLVHFSLFSHHQYKHFLCCKALSTGAYANSTLMWANSSSTSRRVAALQMMRWDWSRNCPAEMPNTLEAAVEQGW